MTVYSFYCFLESSAVMSSVHSPRDGVGDTSKGRTARTGHNLNHEKEQLEKAEEKAKKDALLEEKMKAIRKKNEELIKRQQEIEEDKRNADKLSDQVSKLTLDRTPAGVRTKRSHEPTGLGRARGRVLAKLSGERLKAAEWEEKRKRNIARVEEEQKNPSKTFTSDFLHDDRRMDMSKVTGRTERSWGGHNFHNVRKQMERDRGLPNRSDADPEIHMTGKERQRYLEWKEERRKIDEERKERAKKSGDWGREWDRSKMYDSKKKEWMDPDTDEVFDRSYNRNSRRHEKSRLGDWMGHHDNWENDTFQDDHNKLESSDGSNERSVRHKPWNNQKESRETRKGSFLSCKKELQQTSDKWVKTSEKETKLSHSFIHQEENQPFVVPLTEEWGESTSEDTRNSAVDEHQEHTTLSGQMGESPLLKTEERGAEHNKETSALESEHINHSSAEAEKNIIMPQVDTSTEHCENLTITTFGDSGHEVVSSPNKTSQDTSFTIESNMQQNPQDSFSKLQFDSIEKPVDKDNLEVSSSFSKNVGTTILSPDLESAQKSKYCKKYPQPLDVSYARRRNSQEETKQDPTVPITPDFLKPTYNDPNPKLDWGEYMEEILEESS